MLASTLANASIDEMLQPELPLLAAAYPIQNPTPSRLLYPAMAASSLPLMKRAM
jgi:hypothetical protein